ncbi:MAG: hypothetical protein WCE68_15275 [Anaerolineales bacterium]
MNTPEPKQKTNGSWHNLHAGIWLIGLAILAWRGWWWPGILVLVGISMILEALLRQSEPKAFEPEKPPSPPAPVVAAPLMAAPAEPVSEHRLDLLPATCPQCGGPVRGPEVKWTGPRSANCPYCGGNLPMGKG